MSSNSEDLGNNQVPDAAPVPPLRDSGDDPSDWVLGGEAAVPPHDYGPPIPSRFPSPHSVASEFRQLERRFRSRLTPLLPLDPPRNLPFRFLWTRYRRLAMRGRSEVVDDYGRDPVYAARLAPLLDFLSEKYFRVELDGTSNVPDSGPAILVVNHSGALPYDAVLLGHTLRRQHPSHRLVRPLVEDFLFHAPYVGVFLNRLGAVRACPANAERLLGAGELVAVFPEGVKGPSKLYRDRYKLKRFGRGGFVKLALRSRAPLIPVSIVGAEETHPLLGRVSSLTRSLGMPSLPVTPTFPWLGPLGMMPLPSKWSITFGPPLDLSGHEPEAADDRLLVSSLASEIRDTVQRMVDRSLAKRSSIYFG